MKAQLACQLPLVRGRSPSWCFASSKLLSGLCRHLDISRDHLSSYYKFKLTRRVLTLFVEHLANLSSLDISGHTMLENCTIPSMEEKMGQTR